MKLFIFIFALLSPALIANIVTYELDISAQKLAPAGKSMEVLTINGGIPGPTLRFREGDIARITVRNSLKKEDTSIHWHGLLLPNAQDGVPRLTTPRIKPGGTHVFEFPLTHAGTYWYHSHTGFQEQRGVYGSIVVTPKGGEKVKTDRDYVLVLSDWTNENPKQVMRTLMRGSEYYAIKKGNAQSIWGAHQAGALKEYFAREKSRMEPMDISDVYYNAFLINGQRSSQLPAKAGEKIRLRVINAGASTYFYTHSATGPLTIVAADGPDVEPVKVNRLLISMAETYDLIITMPASGSYEFRATAQDNSGHTSVFFGSGERKIVEDLPSPNLYSMDHMLEAVMAEMEGMEAGSTVVKKEAPRPAPPYRELRALRSTEIPASHPRREIELRLTGDMTRYLWSFNGKTLAEDSTIAVRKGEVLRLNFVNDTMMHHPLHLHGHFFRVLNGQGSHAPLKHTVDVPPMGRRSVEFHANAEGDWLFHCHLLYHMDAGMTRVFSYQKALDPNYEPPLDPKMGYQWNFMIEGEILHSMTMGQAMFMRGREDFVFDWSYAFDHEEYEHDLYWGHYFGPNLYSSVGYRFTNEDDSEDRVFGRINYRLPYMFQSSFELDSEGDARVGLFKELRLTARLSAFGSVQYDTNTDFEWEAGTSFLLNKEFSLIGSYHSEHGAGFGLGFRF